MDCASSFSLASHDEQEHVEGQATGADAQLRPTAARKRRHSQFALPRRKSIVNQILEGEESILLKVRSAEQVFTFC